MVGTISSTVSSNIDGIFLLGSPSKSGKETTGLRGILSTSLVVLAMAAEFSRDVLVLAVGVSVIEKSRETFTYRFFRLRRRLASLGSLLRTTVFSLQRLQIVFFALVLLEQ